MSEPAGDPEAPRKPEAAGTARLRTQYEGLPPAAVKAIAALFCVGVEQESFAEPPDAPAYSVRVRGPIGNVRLLCWPGLNRVDVTCGAHAWIAKQVSETEIIDGLEVIFLDAGWGDVAGGVHGRRAAGDRRFARGGARPLSVCWSPSAARPVARRCPPGTSAE